MYLCVSFYFSQTSTKVVFILFVLIKSPRTFLELLTIVLFTTVNSSGALLHSFCVCVILKVKICGAAAHVLLIRLSFFLLLHPQAQCIIPHECLLSQRHTRTRSTRNEGFGGLVDKTADPLPQRTWLKFKHLM